MKTFAKNFIFNLVYHILLVILPLVTAPYLARVLGADRIGEFSFAQSIVSYFTLFSVLGTTFYGQKKIAECKARNISPQGTFFEIVLLRLLNVTVMFGIYLIFVVRNVDSKWLYICTALETIAVAFDISWFYMGIEEFQAITFCNGISKLVAAACIFIFVKSRADLEKYVFFFCGATLFGNIVQWTMLKGRLDGGRLEKINIGRHYLPALKLFVPQFAIQAYTVLDKTMIGLITRNNFQNGYYDQAQNLVKALVTIVTSIGAVMASRITILWNSGEAGRKERVEEMILFSFRIVFAISLPIAVGSIIIMPRFVPIYYGNGYDPITMLIQMLSVIVPIIGCSNIIGIQLFVPSGREKLLTKSVCFGAVVNVILNVPFIMKWNALGASIASVLAELTVTVMQIYYARNDVRVSEIVKLLIRYLLFSAVIGVVGIVLSMWVMPGIIGMALIIIACVAVYAAILLVIKDPVLKLFSM